MIKHILRNAAVVLMLAATPIVSFAATHPKHVRHHHRTTVTPTALTGNSWEYGHPATPGQKVAEKSWNVRHGISYSTWRMFHKPDPAEQAADARHEAADRAHEAALGHSR